MMHIDVRTGRERIGVRHRSAACPRLVLKTLFASNGRIAGDSGRSARCLHHLVGFVPSGRAAALTRDAGRSRDAHVAAYAAVCGVRLGVRFAAVGAVPSQFRNDPVQVRLQSPPPHTAELALILLHARPQPPQWARFVLVFASQPSFGLPLQSAHPALHVGVQTLFVQLVCPWTLTQGLLHAPQWATLFEVFVSQPVAALPSQSAKGAVHRSTTHTLLAHFASAFWKLHFLPHSPQLFLSSAKFASQPFVASRSQSS